MQSSVVIGKTGHNSFELSGYSPEGHSWASGIYLIMLKTADHTAVQKAVYIK